jgi:hypothetical protein
MNIIKFRNKLKYERSGELSWELKKCIKNVKNDVWI